MTSEGFQDSAYRTICSEKTLQSNAQGFFLEFANYVAKEAGDGWIKNVFGKLKNDYERIRCVYTCDETKDILENFLSKVQEVYRPKNSEFSRKKRAEATDLLKRNETHRALQVFSQSVLRASGSDQGNEDLALALWGRSQALIKSGKFSNALADIQQALKENLPESYKAQAFWSMALCYKALGEENRAKVSFSLAEKLLQNDKKQLEALHEDKRRVYDQDVSVDKTEKPFIAGEPNPTLPHASNKLSTKTSKNLGRYILANQDISAGETLVVEPPYAACLLPDMFGSHCHHCFKILESPFGCPDCASVAFCTVDCREQALSTYHRYECKYLDLLIGSGMSILGHAALRMVTQIGLQKCLEVYRNRDKEKVYQLCTNSHLRQPNDFLQRTLMAAFLLRCLQKSNYFERNNNRVLPMDKEYEIGAMLLFNLQMLQFNAHEIYETRHGSDLRIKGSKSTYIGVALYLTAALFNHECYPALARHFVGKNIVLTSIRPLKANDLVPENYGPTFTRRSLAERKRSLFSRYWFDCQCLACKQDWPSIGRGLENIAKRLRCLTNQCSQSFTLPLKENQVQCPKCKKTIDLSARQSLLKWCEENYHLAFELMNRNDIKKAIDVLCQAIDVYYKISLPPSKETQLAEEMLMVCTADSGNTWQILAKNK